MVNAPTVGKRLKGGMHGNSTPDPVPVRYLLDPACHPVMRNGMGHDRTGLIPSPFSPPPSDPGRKPPRLPGAFHPFSLTVSYTMTPLGRPLIRDTHFQSRKSIRKFVAGMIHFMYENADHGMFAWHVRTFFYTLSP
jgi:hypothetical protein